MPKCDFNNSIEIRLWHGCSPVNLMHIQAHKNEKNSGGLTVCQKKLWTTIKLEKCFNQYCLKQSKILICRDGFCKFPT